MMPSVQYLHRKPVALSDPRDQDVVRGRLCRTQWPSRNVGRGKVAAGSMVKENLLKISESRRTTVIYRTQLDISLQREGVNRW
jgi:hypothetical protein